jgi:hypothetical protein
MNTSSIETQQNAIDEESETSPESAAIVRGASKSAAAAGKGVMVGRLPLPPKTAAVSTASKASRVRIRHHAPRNIPRAPRGGAASRFPSKLPRGRRANTIAKVSDRASNVFDVVSAGNESNKNDNDGSKLSQKQGPLMRLKSMVPTMQQILSFGRVFAVNTLLGMASYGTYEGIIERIAPPADTQSKEEEGNSSNEMGQSPTGALQPNDENDDAMERATLPQHFFVGGLGGTSHAVLSLALEMKLYRNESTPAKQEQGINSKVAKLNRFHLQYPTINYSLASVCHHSLAHAILFGSYQTTKRILLSNVSLPDNNNNIHDITHATIIATAGGVAGQLQHITSHLSEQYLGISGTRVSSFRYLTWPTFRSTLFAAPASSIGFVAFEYGKLMVSQD